MVTPVNPRISSGNLMADSGTGGMINPHWPRVVSVRCRYFGEILFEPAG